MPPASAARWRLKSRRMSCVWVRDLAAGGRTHGSKAAIVEHCFRGERRDLLRTHAAEVGVLGVPHSLQAPQAALVGDHGGARPRRHQAV